MGCIFYGIITNGMRFISLIFYIDKISRIWYLFRSIEFVKRGDGMDPCRFTRFFILKKFKRIIALMLCFTFVFQFYVRRYDEHLNGDSSHPLPNRKLSLYLGYNSAIEPLHERDNTFLYRLVPVSVRYVGKYRRIFCGGLCGALLALIGIKWMVYVLLHISRKTCRRIPVIAMPIGGHAPPLRCFPA
jgi:hypothetical protein